MIVTLMRHYKVNYSWKRKYTPEEYRTAAREYDTAAVLDQSVVLNEDHQKILISSLQRTRATLTYLKGDVKCISTALIDEVPMDPFTDKSKRYSQFRLFLMARMQWLLNSNRQTETRKESIARAKEFISKHLNGNENCLIIGHGFFLRILSREMLKQGFSGKLIRNIGNGEMVTFHKDRALQKEQVNQRKRLASR